MIIYETARLYVREMTEEDLPSLAAMLQDPICMSAYEGPFSDAETRAWMNRQMDRYREHGFGLWAVVLKHNNEMIGQCGLSWQKFDGRQVLEIGYLLQCPCRGKGLLPNTQVVCTANMPTSKMC